MATVTFDKATRIYPGSDKLREAESEGHSID